MIRDLETVRQRFWSKIEQRPDGCWVWTASRDRDGYGKFARLPHRPELAHRVAYELAVGPIPNGLTLDHLCRTRACVNPTHLEPVTFAENVRRGIGFPRRGRSGGSASSPRKTRTAQTHCKRGHSLDEANIYRNTAGARVCRACHKQHVDAYRIRCAARKAVLA